MKECLQFYSDMGVHGLVHWPKRPDVHSRPFSALARDAASFVPEVRAEPRPLASGGPLTEACPSQDYFSLENQCAGTLEAKEDLQAQILLLPTEDPSRAGLAASLADASRSLEVSCFPQIIEFVTE